MSAIAANPTDLTIQQVTELLNGLTTLKTANPSLYNQIIGSDKDAFRPGAIFKAIPAIMADMNGITKSRQSGAGYAFRGIDEVYNALHPMFAKHGVFIVPTIIPAGKVAGPMVVVNKSGQERTINMIDVVVGFTIYGEDGSFVKGSTIGVAFDESDKHANKAMSMALKYFLFQVFMIATEEKLDTEEGDQFTVGKQPAKTGRTSNTPVKPTAPKPEPQVEPVANEKPVLEARPTPVPAAPAPEVSVAPEPTPTKAAPAATAKPADKPAQPAAAPADAAPAVPATPAKPAAAPAGPQPGSPAPGGVVPAAPAKPAAPAGAAPAVVKTPVAAPDTIVENMVKTMNNQGGAGLKSVRAALGKYTFTEAQKASLQAAAAGAEEGAVLFQ